MWLGAQPVPQVFSLIPQILPSALPDTWGRCGMATISPATSTSWVTPVVVKGDDVPLHGERDLSM